MKNLIAFVLVFVSLSAFGQNEFDGKWIDPSDDEYVLYISTYTNKVYGYSQQNRDTIHEKLVFKNNKKIITEMYYNDTFIDTYEYKIVKNNLEVISLSTKAITTYKKQKL
jgi:hypothetical protein